MLARIPKKSEKPKPAHKGKHHKVIKSHVIDDIKIITTACNLRGCGWSETKYVSH